MGGMHPTGMLPCFLEYSRKEELLNILYYPCSHHLVIKPNSLLNSGCDRFHRFPIPISLLPSLKINYKTVTSTKNLHSLSIVENYFLTTFHCIY